MKNQNLLISIFICALGVSCAPSEISNETKVQISPVKKRPLGDEAYAVLSNASSQNNSVVELSEAASVFLESEGSLETKKFSDDLWQGTDKLQRNRNASKILAEVSFHNSPELWSRLRLAQSYIIGVNNTIDSKKAIDLLDVAELSDNAGAQWLLYRAHKINGDVVSANLALKRAAEFGHRRSSEILNEEAKVIQSNK